MKMSHSWGKEIWLELNDKYCYKRIYINAKSSKTSYQYHKKNETNYIIEGQAEIWLENDDNIVEKKIMSAGDFFTVNLQKNIESLQSQILFCKKFQLQKLMM